MTDIFTLSDKKIIVFDLDGTIVRLAVDWQDLKNFLSERYSQIYKEASCNFHSISNCLDYIVERDDEPELMNFIDIVRERGLDAIEKNEPIKETVEFINNLEAFGVNPDTKLAVLSLNTRDCIIESLKHAGVLEKFEYLVGREDVRKWKPDPEGLLKIQEYFESKKEEMIYFGDLEKDIKTGENAGIDAYYIDEIINIVNRKEKK